MAARRASFPERSCARGATPTPSTPGSRPERQLAGIALPQPALHQKSRLRAGAKKARHHTCGMSKRPGGGYHQGWTGKDYHVSGGHEAEAKADEEAERPSRLGLWVLRKLGYKGPDPTPRRKTPHHGAPHHPHPHHDD